MAAVPPRPLPDRLTVIVLRALPGLGDWLCAVPTLRGLRAARPEARIHLIGLADTLPLVRRFHGLVDGFHAFPGWPGLPDRPLDAAAVPGFLAGLRALEADLAIQLQGSGELTNDIVELFGATHVAGFHRKATRCPDPDRFLAWDDSEPEVRRGLRLLARLGLAQAASDDRLVFPLDPVGRDRASALVAATGVVNPYVLLHPGGRRQADRWPADAFGDVGRTLAKRGAGVLVTGDSSEIELAGGVAASIPGATSIAGHTDLDTLGWLLVESELVVSNDTGVAHLADALRVPSVVAFANDDGSRASRWGPLDRALHDVVTGPAAELIARATRRWQVAHGAAA